MTTTLTCPRCGGSFETKAVTNTRCRQCRKVVQVPRSVDSTTSASSPSDIDIPSLPPEPDLLVTATNAAPDGTPYAVAVALGAVLVVALAIAVIRKARRRGHPPP